MKVQCALEVLQKL